jgi:hypothetical protein
MSIGDIEGTINGSVNKRSEEHGSRRNPMSVLRVPVISLNYSGVIPQQKLGTHSIINCGDRQSHLLPTSLVSFFFSSFFFFFLYIGPRQAELDTTLPMRTTETKSAIQSSPHAY